MIKLKKTLTAYEQRISALERELEALKNVRANNYDSSSDTNSYKEVIDEWLNGRKK